MYDNILIPTDGSEAADKAVKHGLELAEIHDSTVHSLYVVDTSIYLRYPSVADTVINELEREAEDVTENVRKMAEDTGVKVVTEVITGVPHEDILGYAEGNDMDLIVMGTHGRTGLRRAIMGSVTEWIVISSDIPVLTLKMGDEEGIEV